LSRDVLTGTLQEKVLDEPNLAEVVASCWPEFEESQFSKVGVVPVGVEVLHRPGSFVDRDADSVRVLSSRMLRTMETARGIGLAANQVGAGVRVLAHNLPRVAPMVLVNPMLVAHSGSWDYEEGCLSLSVDGVRATVRRPKEVTVVSDLLDGARLVLEADELLARVIQHELDHLDGVEYVQRLTGSVRTRVYGRMDAAGVDTSWLPSLPYE
jgi:peptide deformylase